MRSPLGAIAGNAPAATFRMAPSASEAIQIACSGGSGRLSGFASSRPCSKSPPRTYSSRRPSGVQPSWPISWPSSSVYLVSCRPRYSGASATHMLRAPRAFKTQATRPPGPPVRLSGKGADSACSSENRGAGAPAAAASKHNVSDTFRILTPFSHTKHRIRKECVERLGSLLRAGPWGGVS
jgi:hypothetical protein